MKKIIFLFYILFILSCADESLVNIKNNIDNGSQNPINPDSGSQNPNNPQDIIPAIPLEPPKHVIPAIPLEPSSSIYDYDVIVSTISHINRDTDINKLGFEPCSDDPSDSVLADKLGRPTSTSTETRYVSAYLGDTGQTINIIIYDSCKVGDYSNKYFDIDIYSYKSFKIHDRELIWETMAEYIKKDPYTNKDNKKETITIKSSVGK